MLLPLCDRCYVTIIPVYLADVIAKVADVIANQLQIFWLLLLPYRSSLADVVAMVADVITTFPF